ncbi:M15 family metallopeptidase [Nocardioides sp. SYSU D00038]|uniref:M15 family metallopeptidase n=1 Tax=Nocardioides sp. SYSU D00038 TaxID=2812554 RepID=UPI001967C4D4|nr:M15 family metallopeptidase [Nocardioides sp. SYSU D00038]
MTLPLPARASTRVTTLATTLAALAALTVGCDATDPAKPTPDARPDVRPLDDAPDRPPRDPERGSLRRLDPALLAAFRAASRAAEADGIRMVVTSGWRSRAHQARLYDEAVERYGSEEEARRYVATPDTSAHVTGDAIDVGPTDAADWLSSHGAEHGLCQVFANELWHYELDPTPDGECPAQLPDGSYRG